MEVVGYAFELLELVKCPNVGKEEALVVSGARLLLVVTEGVADDDEVTDEEATAETLEMLLEAVEELIEVAEEVVGVIAEVEEVDDTNDEVELAALKIDDDDDDDELVSSSTKS